MNDRPTIRFPEDEGWHPEANDEWWYFNSHLSVEDGKNYGLVVCFFPTYLLFTIIDASNRRVLHKAVVQGEEFRGSTQILDIRFGSNWWRQIPGKPFNYKIHCEIGGLKADLTMRSLKTPLMVDGTGKIREGLLGHSFYYAQTRLKVEGTIEINGRRKLVTGMGWIDRQWGVWDWSGLGGWGWYSIQLNNNTDILLIRISHPLTGRIAVQSLNISDEEGRTRVVTDFYVKKTVKWKSPATDVDYAAGWTIGSPDLFELQIQPLILDQEIVPGLWEGKCLVYGSYKGQEVKGVAYVEQANSRIYGGVFKRLIFLMFGVINHIGRRVFPRRDFVGWIFWKIFRLT